VKSVSSQEAPLPEVATSSSASKLERQKRAALVSTIVLLFLIAYLSWRQPSPGQLDGPATFPHLKWFRYPIEVHWQNRPPTYPSNWFLYPFAVSPKQRPSEKQDALYSISAVPGGNGNILVAVGDRGRILRTTDGGVNWEPQNIREANGSPSSIGSPLVRVTFTDALNGFAVGFRTFLRTDDGGISWVLHVLPRESPHDIFFSDANTGWMVADNGRIFTTTNGGAYWNLAYSQSRADLWSVTFTDPQTGYAAADDGTVLKTTDSGNLWYPQIALDQYHQGYLSSVFFSDANAGWAVGREILHTTDGGEHWRGQRFVVDQSHPSSSLTNVFFVNTRNGWTLGSQGTILNTTNGGENWNPQVSGTDENLWSVIFADDQRGWVVGDNGTILHSTDGGANWTPQNAYPYRRYPAPWFYMALAFILPLFFWALTPVTVPPTTLQDNITADSPVESVEDDRLGQKTLVERLSGFLQNTNTLPPLVISLQAPWGMGKSTVMRMLQSNLEKNRAAVTVWFNAWHHQTEDQLLAYLLETIQKEAVPPWISRKGLPFRVNLLRERLFQPKGIDRLALVVTGIVFVSLQNLKPNWLAVIPYSHLWLRYAAAVLATLPILDALVAFKSNPDKLTDKTGGFLVDTFKELIRLPSLVGKSDVRQEFANNLKDVVAALRPQRLIIFLDDLDRCKPDQVVQILESINFLSSVAQCFLIVGADYEKVETLVANQFESIALREEENRTRSTAGNDAIGLRVRYAREYLKKIVNLRLNLKLPSNYVAFFARRSAADTKRGKWVSTLGTFATVALMGTFLWAMLLGQPGEKPAEITAPSGPTKQSKSIPLAAIAAPPDSDRVTTSTPRYQTNIVTPRFRNIDSDRIPFRQNNNVPGLESIASRRGSTSFQQDGSSFRNVLSVGLPLFFAIVALLYWFNLPREVEQAVDVDTFTEALEAYSAEIFWKCESPREARRFLNYLRLVATGSGQKDTDILKELRQKYGGQFDRDLVALAVSGTAASTSNSEVEQYYKAQCELFGLNENTFKPKEGVHEA
jgi:photosystem II stability/assembly factor-like uncharacterized protein